MEPKPRERKVSRRYRMEYEGVWLSIWLGTPLVVLLIIYALHVLKLW